jgi:hypothetical protein
VPSVFSHAAFRYVDVVIGALAAAAVLMFAATVAGKANGGSHAATRRSARHAVTTPDPTDARTCLAHRRDRSNDRMSTPATT